MQEVDARGLSCPEPVMLAANALKAGTPVSVLVDEEYQKVNVEKYARETGHTFSDSLIDDHYEIIIN